MFSRLSSSLLIAFLLSPEKSCIFEKLCQGRTGVVGFYHPVEKTDKLDGPSRAQNREVKAPEHQ